MKTKAKTALAALFAAGLLMAAAPQSADARHDRHYRPSKKSYKYKAPKKSSSVKISLHGGNYGYYPAPVYHHAPVYHRPPVHCYTPPRVVHYQPYHYQPYRSSSVGWNVSFGGHFR